MTRGDRFRYILLAVYATQRWWLPNGPIDVAPLGEVALFGGLLTATLWFRRAMAIKE